MALGCVHTAADQAWPDQTRPDKTRQNQFDWNSGNKFKRKRSSCRKSWPDTTSIVLLCLEHDASCAIRCQSASAVAGETCPASTRNVSSSWFGRDHSCMMERIKSMATGTLSRRLGKTSARRWTMKVIVTTRSNLCITGNIYLLQHKYTMTVVWNIASFINNVTSVHITMDNTE